MRRALPLALVLLLAAPVAPASAGQGNEVAVSLLGSGVLGLVAFPVGLAIHALILAYAPRRGAGLVHPVETYRLKTLLLGGAHAVFFVLLMSATNAGAPGLSALLFVVWVMAAFAGSHGLARSIGARVLDQPSDGPGELKALCVGWFVLVFASAFPGLGWLLAVYWALRATGGVILTLLSVPEPPREAPPPGP